MIPLASPIFNLQEAVQWRKEHAGAQRTVVFTNGVFDLLHAGHVSYLEWARAQGDALIVGVNEDEVGAAAEGETRGRSFSFAENVRACWQGCRSVDAVIGFAEMTPETLLDKLRPDIHVKSAQYRIEDLPERIVIESYGGRIVPCPAQRGEKEQHRHRRADRGARARVVRIAFTVNGPGEYAGWLRPLLTALYRRGIQTWMPACFCAG